ncbi:hypothetical protein [Burkholderia anthina]|uniref:hypothetical protein n=1 Tax=Burkholderia anthina TaxID=179879 RepID=UPI00158C231C|nr:hypothetical protein [Burkholderia anthina]
MLGKIKFYDGGFQPAIGVSGFDFEWAPDGTFRAVAAFSEPVRVTHGNEALFESVRDTLAAAVRAGLAQVDRTHAGARARNVEICQRQYGGSIEQWDRYHDAYLEDAASRALRDAEDQARKEHIRREAEREAERQRNIEICRRVTGNFASWVRYPDATLREWAARAIDLAWDEAIFEERDRRARRERDDRVDACLSYFKQRDRGFFASLESAILRQWYSAIPSFRFIS